MTVILRPATTPDPYGNFRTDFENAPHEKWLLGWTNKGYRFIRYLVEKPNNGVDPTRPGWETKEGYASNVFGLDDKEEIILTRWAYLYPNPD